MCYVYNQWYDISCATLYVSQILFLLCIAFHYLIVTNLVPVLSLFLQLTRLHWGHELVDLFHIQCDTLLLFNYLCIYFL